MFTINDDSIDKVDSLASPVQVNLGPIVFKCLLGLQFVRGDTPTMWLKAHCIKSTWAQ